MTKEDWLDIRKREEIPLSVFYEYYLDKRDKRAVISLVEFEQLFPQFMSFGIALIGTKVISTSFESVIHKVYNYFDEKFELV